MCTADILQGHAEAVQVIYDPKQVTYDRLLDVFFKKHDSTTLNRQGGDGAPPSDLHRRCLTAGPVLPAGSSIPSDYRSLPASPPLRIMFAGMLMSPRLPASPVEHPVGTQYRSGIYYHDEEQKARRDALCARRSLRPMCALAWSPTDTFTPNAPPQAAAEKAKAAVPRCVTEIVPATAFYAAEKYHQSYLAKGMLQFIQRATVFSRLLRDVFYSAQRACMTLQVGATAWRRAQPRVARIRSAAMAKL